MTATGTSSESSPDSATDDSTESVALADAAAVFGLSKKDMFRAPGAQTMQDMSCKQLGYCLSNLVPQLSSTRVMELGGELDSCLSISVHSCCMVL